MILYSITFFVTTTLVIFKEKYAQITGMFIAFLFVAIVVGLRGRSVGVDTESYYHWFHLINHDPTSNIVEKCEPLYKLLNQSVFASGGGPEIVVFICALITLCLIAYVAYRYSPSILLSLAGWYVFGTFFSMHNAVRQCVASAIIFYSIRFIIQRRLVKFLITIAIAAGFHYSALIFLPMYFLYKTNCKRVILTVSWLISLICVFMPNFLIQLLQDNRYLIPQQYVWLIFSTQVTEFELKGGPKLMFLQFICLSLLYVYGRIKENTYRFIIFLTIIGLILNNMFIHYGVMVRLSQYFTIFITLSLPIAIQDVFKRYNRVLVSFIMYLCCMILYLRMVSVNTNAIFPYYTIFN